MPESSLMWGENASARGVLLFEGGCDSRQEAFLNLMLPVITSTLRHFDASAAVGSRRSAALRRRLRLINKNRGAHEQGVVFKVRCCPHDSSSLCSGISERQKVALVPCILTGKSMSAGSEDTSQQCTNSIAAESWPT